MTNRDILITLGRSLGTPIAELPPADLPPTVGPREGFVYGPGSDLARATGWNPLFDAWRSAQLHREQWWQETKTAVNAAILPATAIRPPAKVAARLADVVQNCGLADPAAAQYASAALLAEAPATAVGILGAWDFREECCHRYAWAVPSDDALSALLALGPLVEPFAGTGYWSRLLRDRGGDVVASDEAPPGSGRDNCWHERPGAAAWTAVRTERAAVTTAEHSDRALFMCWPPNHEPDAALALRAYRGSAFAYLADRHLSADATFYAELAADWVCVRTIPVPRWRGCGDSLTIWRRRDAGPSITPPDVPGGG